MKKIGLLLVITALSISCDNILKNAGYIKQTECDNILKGYIKPTDDLAKIDPIQGIYIFIGCEPVKDFDIVDTISHDVFADIASSGKGKKLLGKVLEGAITTYENISFNELRNKMIEEAMKMKKKKNIDFDGLYFHDKLTECELIKFK